ncbi:hypothetical protein MRX96_011403, partial [Rhipicephalus microplus]
MAIRRGQLEATGTTPPGSQLGTTDCVKIRVPCGSSILGSRPRKSLPRAFDRTSWSPDGLVDKLPHHLAYLPTRPQYFS